MMDEAFMARRRAAGILEDVDSLGFSVVPHHRFDTGTGEEIMAKKSDAIVVSATPDVAKLASMKSQGAELAEFLRSRPCETPEQEAWFSSQLSSVRGLLKMLEDERTSITKPMLDAKRRVDGLFSPATSPLKDCETVIRDKLASAARARFAAEAEARRLAADAAATGDHLGAVEALASAPDAVTTSGSSARAVWRHVVDDFAALPDEYKLTNHDALAELSKGANEPAAVPGVRWYLDAAVRAK
jgi:hypothetical protein